MESALVGVAMGVMKPLLSKLCKVLQEKSAKHKSLERDTKFLRDEMNTMSATLQILADSEELDGEMKNWRDNVRELSYDMEDCVDDFIAHGVYQRDGPTGLIPKIREKLKKRKPRNNTVSEIEQLKTRLTEASKRHRRYTITPPPAAPDPNTCAQDPLPLLQALFPVDELMGIDDPKEHIIELLKKFQVVSIVGPGGLGKTTLANQVYSAVSAVDDKFSCVAFVSISRKPNMKTLLRDLAERVGITHTAPTDDVRRLIERLRDYLKDKRYFIVIDDVWGVETWDTISHALIKNDCGSRIITTTRNREVASSFAKGGYVYKMRPLGSADSRKLLFERAFGREKQDYPHLEKVSCDILKKCGGLPLAIITISGMLFHKYGLDEWKRVLAAIGSALAKDPAADRMTQILSLSYFDLPHHLRTCFLYLSLFPEDHIIQKDDLIIRWISEGFIEENQGRSAYDVGEGYLNDLINRSLIELVGLKCGQVEACRVHDIVLDFITCKAGEENFATSLDVDENIHDSSHRIHRLCIRNRHWDGLAAVPTSMKLSHVRSLTLFGSFMTNDNLFAFPYIRVLDMSNCLTDFGNDHLENIKKLVFLKYLRFGVIQINRLPEGMEDLQHLETLDVRGTSIRKFPSTITSLQRLARLIVPEFTVFPAGTIGQMKSLEELDSICVPRDDSQAKALQEFSQLTKLRKLIVSCSFNWSYKWDERSNMVGNFQSYVGTLISACNLHHLDFCTSSSRQRPNINIVLSMEPWCPAAPCGLRKLQFTFCYINKVPNWLSSCANLRELDLCIVSIGPEDIVVLGAIPALLGLTLRTKNDHQGVILIPGGHGFTILNYFCLRILGCGNSLLFESGSMPKLEYLELEISEQNKMECLNGASYCGINHLCSLNKVVISEHNKMGHFNGASDFGINHLTALTKVEIFIIIQGCNPDIGLPGDTVERLVKAAIETLPKHPALSFKRGYGSY